MSDGEPSRGKRLHVRLRRFVLTSDRQSCQVVLSESLVSPTAFTYADVMHATAIVGGKVVRFKLSAAVARAHWQNRRQAMTEAEAIAFVETKRRGRALRRARPYLASHP